MLDSTLDVPLGVGFLNRIPYLNALPLHWKTHCHKFNVLLLTFLSYASYHLARKPTSVVKNVLHYKNCSTAVYQNRDANPLDDNWCHWPPFDGANADTLLGALDSSFLFAYAIGMYFMGPLAERLNLRWFLSFGMISSGLFGALFGVAYYADIHSLTYFIVIQILAGLCQSTGWPGCVAALGNWFGKSKRGLIMGVWRSHHSVGNIFGTLLAAVFVERNWGLSFVVPSALIAGLGILTFLLLVSDPRAVGCPSPDHCSDNSPKKNKQALELLEKARSPDNDVLPDLSLPGEKEVAISFKRALAIPGVAEYSMCLFFTKFINYTFLYWLPRFIQETRLDLGAKSSADLSTLFDIGGIFGGILAGFISDVTSASAITCAAAFLLSFPMLFMYQSFASASVTINVVLLFIVGLLVNSPYALITTAVSADLGTHPDFRGSARALATVTAIIDATGSVGAALGPLTAGPLSTLGWEYVFYALMAANALGLLMLTRLVIKEARKYMVQRTARAPANELNEL